MNDKLQHPYDTIDVLVKVSVDRNIAPLVSALNKIPGVYTYSCCGGNLYSSADMRAYVMLWGPTAFLMKLRDLISCLPFVSLEPIYAVSDYLYLFLPPELIDDLSSRIEQLAL